jgi:hypothetical protein
MKGRKPTRVTKGLVIASPYVDHILSGLKTWEMRTTHTRVRGPIAQIRKGSGSIVGIVKVVDSIGPFSLSELRRHRAKHRIPGALLRSAASRWNYAWVLEDVRRLGMPLRYRHPSGAVIWVSLDQSARRGIARAL